MTFESYLIIYCLKWMRIEWIQDSKSIFVKILIFNEKQKQIITKFINIQ